MKNTSLPIDTILVANRGEIASRIFRSCKKLGITSVAVYSEADRNAKFVSEADIAIYIGESTPNQSYLNQDKIIAAAQQTNASAIHPGYGFLSENSSFALRCQKEDIIFIGPNSNAIEKMGSKAESKRLMESHNVPVVPGYNDEDQSLDTLKEAAEKIGYPLLLKATAGGGGRGMRIVHQKEELEKSIQAAKRESKSAFGDDRLILEKYVASGRHIEFQIFGDQHGNVIHLFERECSIQRRYQKIIEESPSPVMDTSLRTRMSEAAIQAARALNYDNAGTVEFIYDDQSEEFYFLEVNTRLQVEHPVTEEITGVDLVELQIESAQGKPLRLKQADVNTNGYAIEVRLYAEDPDNNFLPVTGKVGVFKTPDLDGLRVESAISSGSEISIFYDPMIAKIIMHGANRKEAIRKLNYALKHTICQGITTNLSFLCDITQDPSFINGDYNTHFVEHFVKRNKNNKDNGHLSAIAASFLSWSQRNEKRSLFKGLPSGWRNSFYEAQYDIWLNKDREQKIEYVHCGNKINYTVDSDHYEVKYLDFENDFLRLEINNRVYKFNISQSGDQFYVHNAQYGNDTLTLKSKFPEATTAADENGYITPMPAQIVKVLVATEQAVNTGDDLIIISSMKMESAIQANTDGIVEEIFVKEGQNVTSGFELIKITENKNQ